MKRKSFLEYLIERYSRTEFVGKAYKTDKEMIDHFLSGEVKISIKDILGYISEWLEEDSKIPSRFQIGDMVSIRERPYFVVDTAKVIKVHFTESKVMYDLEIEIPFEGTDNYPPGSYYTRIYNVDSVFVKEL